MMTCEKKNKSDILFYIAIIIYTIIDTVSRSTVIYGNPEAWSLLFKISRYICYGLCALKILVQRYRKKQFFLYIFLTLVLLAAAIKSDNTSFLMMIFFFIAVQKVNAKKVLICFSITKAILLVGIVGTSQLGIIQNVLMDAERNRYALGFDWVTVAPIACMFLIFSVFNINKGKSSILTYIVVLLVSLWLFQKTKTRLSFIISLFYLIVLFVVEYLGKSKWRIISKIGFANCMLPLLICVLSLLFYSMYQPNDALWQKIDQLLSNRMIYCKNALENYKITLFGQKIEWTGHGLYESQINEISEDFVDCAYLRYLLLYGICGLGVIISAYTIGIYNAVKMGNFKLVFTLLCILIFCITEYWIADIAMNPFILICLSDTSFTRNRKINAYIRKLSINIGLLACIL